MSYENNGRLDVYDDYEGWEIEDFDDVLAMLDVLKRDLEILNEWAFESGSTWQGPLADLLGMVNMLLKEGEE